MDEVREETGQHLTVDDYMLLVSREKVIEFVEEGGKLQELHVHWLPVKQRVLSLLLLTMKKETDCISLERL